MAKDTRRILSGISLSEGTFIEGQEDELEHHLTAAQVDHLKRQKALEGDWTGKAPKDEKPDARQARLAKLKQEADDAKAAEVAKAEPAKAESKPHVEKLHDKGK